MPFLQQTLPGTPVSLEVPLSDKERMEAPYSNVLGWNFAPAPGDRPDTFIFTTEVRQQMMPKEAGGRRQHH